MKEERQVRLKASRRKYKKSNIEQKTMELKKGTVEKMNINKSWSLE